MCRQFWDFQIDSNVMINERAPLVMAPPLPQVEILRGEYLTKLRGRYRELCYVDKGIHCPHDSFNRWLLEMKVADRGDDPLLPSDCPKETSASMYRDISTKSRQCECTENYIPIVLQEPKTSIDARANLLQYAESIRDFVEKSGSHDSVKRSAEETITWLQHHYASLGVYKERLGLLKEQSEHILTHTPHADDSVEKICIEIYRLSQEYAQKLQEQHWGFLEDCGIERPLALQKPLFQKVACHPVRLASSCPRLPGTECVKGKTAVLWYGGEPLHINPDYLKKLAHLYERSCIDDPEFNNFLTRVWCLLKRYQTFFGVEKKEGVGLQRALPVPVFKFLHRVFGVTFECFASPLNCYFKQFCSAFPDTDTYFGSRGKILDFCPLTGSFETGPPFSEELEEAMVDHLEKLLEASQEPLSFIIFIPDWRCPIAEAIVKLESSRFNRQQTVIRAFEHVYRHGLQHVKPGACEDGHGVPAGHGTLVVFLQNESGYLKWRPTPERVEELRLAFMQKEDRNKTTWRPA